MLPVAHRRASRPVLVLLQLLVFVTYIFGPTATFAEDPTPEPSPTESVAPEPSTEPTPEATPAPSEPDPTPVPSEPDPTAAPDPTPIPSDPHPTASPEPDPTPAPSEPDQTPGTRPYLVTFASGTDDARQLEILASANVTDESAIPQLSMRSVLLHEASYFDELSALNAFAEVVRVDLDRTRAVEAAPSDTSYADQWSLPKIGWDQLYGTVGIAGTSTVAVLDTGVDATHPDLDGVVLPGTSVLDGSNGLSDPNGHGTWMAGIVAAETDNGTGIAGTAYAGVSVLPVTVLGADGTGQDSDIIAGVVYAADADADVILMSFSNPGFSPALQAAIDYAWASGAVLVAATGNDGSTLQPSRPGTAASLASPRPMPSTPWPPPRTTEAPCSWRRRASISLLPPLGGASRPSPAPRLLPPRSPEPRPFSWPTSPPSRTASSSRASRAPPIRPATPAEPATAASTWPAPWPMPRPIRSSLRRCPGRRRRSARRSVCRRQPSRAARSPSVVLRAGAAVGCGSLDSSFSDGEEVCARALLNTNNGGGNNQFRMQWFRPNGTLARNELFQNLPSGTANIVRDDEFVPDAAGTWTVIACNGESSSICAGGRISTRRHSKLSRTTTPAP